MAARIVIVTGSPGTGKTTVSHILAENSTYDKSAHIEVDDYWNCICKGYSHPWLEISGDQNETVVEAVVASAVRYCESGYEVFVAGTIGPWFLNPWITVAKRGIDVRYCILRPNEEETVTRATERPQRESFPLNADIIKEVWRSFTNLGEYEPYVIDTTSHSVDESVAIIQGKLRKGLFRIV